MWGRRTDPKGRSGFAHMFEHLMFKATRNLASEQMDRLTEDVGGYNNASTDDDYTDYFEVVPANTTCSNCCSPKPTGCRAWWWNPSASNPNARWWRRNCASPRSRDPYGKLFSVYLSPASYARHPVRTLHDR